MSACANCNTPFKKKPGNAGYYRFSLEKQLPSSKCEARVEIEGLTGQPVTPLSKVLEGKFLCSSCWSLLNASSKYKEACKEFLGKTTTPSYIGQKRTVSRSESGTVSSPSTSFKRPRFTSTPLQSKVKAARSIFSSGTKKHTKWDPIITAIRSRQYRRAIRGIYHATKACKKHFIVVVCEIVRNEVRTLKSKKASLPLAKPINIPNLQEFSWDEILKQICESAPLLTGVLKGAVTTKRNDESLIRGQNVKLKPIVGTSLALLLHARFPITFSFLQTLLSIQFWRGKLKRDTLQQLSKLGLCLGPGATLSAIDRVRQGFDRAALHLKNDLEEYLQDKTDRHLVVETSTQEAADLSIALSFTVPNIEDEIDEGSDTVSVSTEALITGSTDSGEVSSMASFESLEDDNNSSSSSSNSSNKSDDNAAEMEVSDSDDGDIYAETIDTEPDRRHPPPGFTFCWDNVGKKVITRRPTANFKNRYINMALGYMSMNRVQTTHLFDPVEETIQASNIPLPAFIPGDEDHDHLESRMIIIVGRIIVHHLEYFKKHFLKCVVNHIVHDHTLESTYKSVLVNLGVFKEDPSSTQGAIGIFTKLHKYVPVIDGKPCISVVYGDGLSCERGNDAQNARANGLDPIERLEGLEPAAQEFHKEMILLQDFYDDFYLSSSAADRGTICQVRNMFNFRRVKPDISDNFSNAWELMCVITESFVSLIAMQLLNMQDVSSVPENHPSAIETASDDDKTKYFNDICRNIVKFLWHSLDTDALKQDDGTGMSVFCCGEENEDEVIGCDARSNCQNGEYFHFSCTGIDINAIPSPWYCSDECRQRSTIQYKYCVCKTDLGSDEPMIGCSSEHLCLKDEWYHMKCIGLDPSKSVKGHWFCDPGCRRRWKGKSRMKKGEPSTQEEDRKQTYSLAVVWRGLNLLCRRDAIREADGEATMAYWKLDLVNFFAKKHPKYVILAHRLIACINAWASKKVQHDLIHNRTVNYAGGIGRNLPNDFMNEILNRLFKDLLESAKGKYTDTTIDRCSQIIGPFGDALDAIFDANVIEHEHKIYRHRKRSFKRDENVSDLILILEPETLFENHPGRYHTAFQTFKFSENPKQAGKFLAKMKQLSKKLDKRRQVVLNN